MLIKIQFPDIGGLQNTVLQEFATILGTKKLQIVHVGDINHWIVISSSQLWVVKEMTLKFMTHYKLLLI